MPSMFQYQEAGCTMLNSGLLSRSTDVCNSQCSRYNNGECIAYKKLLEIKPLSATNVLFTNTVAAEALRLGISKSEVRRRRTEISTGK